MNASWRRIVLGALLAAAPGLDRVNAGDADVAWPAATREGRSCSYWWRQGSAVEVTNVAANCIRDLDRRKVVWRTFNDINFVNLAYKPFDASNWPLTESGLLGPVTLQPAGDADRP
jgi:hypothetical protein